jgi:hypothetical protein
VLLAHDLVEAARSHPHREGCPGAGPPRPAGRAGAAVLLVPGGAGAGIGGVEVVEEGAGHPLRLAAAPVVACPQGGRWAYDQHADHVGATGGRSPLGDGHDDDHDDQHSAGSTGDPARPFQE